MRGWNSVQGLQFENLVVNNFEALLAPLGLTGVEIVSVAPCRKRGKRGEGCQVDLLIQTRRALYVVEIKRKEMHRTSMLIKLETSPDLILSTLPTTPDGGLIRRGRQVKCAAGGVP